MESTCQNKDGTYGLQIHASVFQLAYSLNSQSLPSWSLLIHFLHHVEYQCQPG